MGEQETRLKETQAHRWVKRERENEEEQREGTGTEFRGRDATELLVLHL